VIYLALGHRYLEWILSESPRVGVVVAVARCSDGDRRRREVPQSGDDASRRFSTPLIGTVRAVSGDHDEPHVYTLAPTSLYMVLRDGVHQP